MSDEYSYRDARLSIWQSAAHQTHLKYPSPKQAGTDASGGKQQNPFMAPVHVVAATAKELKKPLCWLGHAIATGIFDIESKLHLLSDCGKAAAKFLLAELDQNQANSDLYAGELRKAECDALGWAQCLTTYLGYKALGENPPYRPNQNVVVDLGTKSRIAIIGDWGTGDDVSKNVLEQVAKFKPEILLHLGDVYYAGTESEAKGNFLDICQSILPNIPLYTLCGNHDMYSGGGGYYWLLDQIGQKASYFCLKNDNWMFLAMDTGFHDNNPFNVSTNMTKLVSQEEWSEATWHLSQISNAGNRKLVLLSHHQLFSPFGSVGSVDGTAYAYNPTLYDVFAPVLSKVEWWFWGHEHTLGIFPPHIGLKRGRCLGASAVPVFSDQQQYATASGLQTLNGAPMPTWDSNGELGTSANMYNNCFAMMTLNGASATVDYYEVPLLKEARKFNVTDTA
jgi:hypothetical protein